MSAVAQRPAKVRNRILANSEKPVPLDEFGKLREIDRTYETVLRWVNEGLENRNTGEIVRLETCRGTRGLCTSIEAYRRMIEELNEG